MLVAAMVGLDARATMDIDATIKGTYVNVEAVEIFEEVQVDANMQKLWNLYEM